VSAKITDPSANFTSSGVKIGDLVRAGSAFSVVSAIVSSTELAVEEWWSDTTRYPTSAPSAATAYTVYNAYYGKVASSTGTTITVARWYDITGATVTPSNGTRYEALAVLPNYQGIRGGSAGSRDWIVTGNAVRRTMADSIALNAGTHNTIVSFFIAVRAALAQQRSMTVTSSATLPRVRTGELPLRTVPGATSTLPKLAVLVLTGTTSRITAVKPMES
jgi:hypothetical protein